MDPNVLDDLETNEKEKEQIRNVFKRNEKSQKPVEETPPRKEIFKRNAFGGRARIPVVNNNRRPYNRRRRYTGRGTKISETITKDDKHSTLIWNDNDPFTFVDYE